MIQNFDFTLDPGESRHLTFGEVDFVFCRQADVPIDFIVNQQTTSLETGGEYEHREGLFSRATIRNPSTKRPVTVRLKMGTSRYRQIIIQGEVVIDPRVKTATGDFVSDQRADHPVFVAMDYKREPVITAGSGTMTLEADATAFLEGYRPLNGGVVYEDTIEAYYSGTNDYAIKLDRATGQLIASDKIVSDVGPMQAGCPIGGGQWLLGGDDGYTYVWTFGQVNNIASTDRYSNFQCEGAFWVCIFVGPGGDYWGVDSDYKWYNITQAYKAFTLTSSHRFGCALGNDVVAISMGEVFTVMREDTAGAWTQVNEFNGSGFAIRNGGSANVEASTGKILVLDSDSIDETYNVIEVEPEDYGQGEIHYGIAREGCLKIPRLFNPGIQHDARTDAQVSVEFVNGMAYASGQVIKYTLDLLGIDTSGDYLDGITGFKARTRFGEINKDLGGRTFSADEIADDFDDVELPQTVTITALESLWSNRV
ncbi:MAG: hypothetical protein KA296_13750 [Marinobacter sp.]|nr:hypothetical protein [Marinobacter sp.]